MLHSKHNFTPLRCAQLHIWQNLFSLATQPVVPFGHVLFCIFGHFSQAIPQTPIRMFIAIPLFVTFLLHPLLRVDLELKISFKI